MGRTSIREIVEKKMGTDFFTILQNQAFSGITDATVGCAKLEEVTGISCVPLTMVKTIQKGIENNEIPKDSPLTKWCEAKGTGRRGKKGVDEKIEKHFGKPFAEVIQDCLQGIDNLSLAPEAIEKASKGRITVSIGGLKSAFERAIENGKIEKDGFIADLIVPRRKRKSKGNDATPVKSQSTERVIPSHEKCQQCGWEGNGVVTFVENKPSPLNKAQRCPKCGVFGAKEVHFIYNGTQIIHKGTEFKKADRERYPSGGFYKEFRFFHEDNTPMVSPY